ncbi:MAG: hypothetical protein JXQ77_05530 [Campylobacterales bacterium]|nr:hypothetical protein [Campylobacterales bacterium]
MKGLKSLFFGLALVFVYWYMFADKQSHFELKNHSGKEIKIVKFIIGDNEILWKDNKIHSLENNHTLWLCNALILNRYKNASFYLITKEGNKTKQSTACSLKYKILPFISVDSQYSIVYEKNGKLKCSYKGLDYQETCRNSIYKIERKK